jgi:hypothetical protein
MLMVLTGCDKDWEISPGIGRDVIQKKVDGIVFKFCLLNEHGKAATVFNEGENFSFYFAVTNKSGKKLDFDAAFAETNRNDFCTVYNSEGLNLGKPFDMLGALYIGTAASPFKDGETYIFEVPWSDNRDSVWFWDVATYESTHQQPLEKGNYHTGFNHRFRFNGEQRVYTDTLSFRINFRLKYPPSKKVDLRSP